jgi:hypothetical protein
MANPGAGGQKVNGSMRRTAPICKVGFQECSATDGALGFGHAKLELFHEIQPQTSGEDVCMYYLCPL